MAQEIRDIEERLKALLSKADKLFKKSPPPADEEIPDVIPGAVPEAPVPEKAPMLLEAPAIVNLLEPAPQAPNVADVEPPAPTVIPMPPASPDVTETPREGTEIPFLIGYPEPLSEAAKELQKSLECLKPKFTKMKFHLRGRGCVPYSQDHPLQESFFGQIRDQRDGVLLVITTHRPSTKTPHPLAAEAARRGLYFQEVLSEVIAKKAFYFDFLLGLVFFLKTHKAPPAGADPEPPNDEGTVDGMGPGKWV